MTVDFSDLRTIRTNHHGGVIEFVLDHPDNDKNLFDWERIQDLGQIFARLRDERDARVVVLRGEGEYFSAGGHHSGIFLSISTDASAREEIRLLMRRLTADILDLHMPLITVLNGPAIGMGVWIGLLGDIVFAADDAWVSDPHVPLGLSTGSTPVLWQAILGPTRAKHYMFTGDRITAAEAERFGLVTFVESKANVTAAAHAYADRLAKLPPLALRHTKAVINDVLRDQFNRITEAGIALENLDFLTEDHTEAIAAFRDKRDGNFVGR